jgi:glutamate-5-semialdehyde dehydrogenase
MSLETMIKDMAKAGKEASRELRKVSRAKKDAALQLMAGKLLEREKAIRQENEKDLALAKEQGLSSAMLDRLTLDAKLPSMAGRFMKYALPDSGR